MNVCLIGQKFMGRTHSNAYLNVGRFFDLPVEPRMYCISGRNRGELETFARRWGWQHARTDWRQAVSDPQVGLVDVGTPNHLHCEMSIAALEAGKNVACEKPLAGTLDEARQMRDAAKKHRRQKTFVWYNYRRTPAVALAYQLAREGRLGRIYHVRAFYLQEWAKPEVPLLWRFDKQAAGSGAHGDLGAHIIDMARFITADEIVEVSGAIQETFIKERDIPTQVAKGGIAGGARSTGRRKGKVTIDDATLFLARFRQGAVASFESTRMATGNQNKNGLEINGDKGSIYFNFESMNELMYYDATLPRKVQGWQRILVTNGPNHPYASAWWPDGHGLGYEHTFVNQAADIMKVLGGQKPLVPMPDFEDAYQTQRVMEAAVVSARQRCAVKLNEIK
jgi:predicted dehydrogenase